MMSPMASKLSQEVLSPSAKAPSPRRLVADIGSPQQLAVKIWKQLGYIWFRVSCAWILSTEALFNAATNGPLAEKFV